MRFCSVFASVLLVAVTGILCQRCTKTTDCDCGYMCVSQSDTLPCPEDEKCTCKQGCGVGNVYISPGQSVRAYCNDCACLGDPEMHKGVPACSFAAWCDLPENVTLVQDNRYNCE